MPLSSEYIFSVKKRIIFTNTVLEGDMEKKTKTIPRFVWALIFVVLGYFVIRHAAGMLLPFIIGYLVSLVISPIVRFLWERAKIPKRFSSVVLVLLILLFIGVLVYLGISRLYEEIAGLVSRLERRDETLILPLENMFLSIRQFFSRFEFFETIEKLTGIEDVGKKISSALFDSVYSVLSRIPESLASVIGKTPRLLIGFFVTVLASYYFVCDKDKIKGGLMDILPRRAYNILERLLLGARTTMRKYARGYLLILLITFAESLIGLAILGVRYSFLLAVLIAAVDILPVLGAGTVLIPWAAVLFFMKNYRLALGLIILYGVMTIIRQLAEPKIIGKSLGLHPIVSLFSMYVGLYFFGIWGMILGPAVSLIVKTYLSEMKEPVRE